MSLVIHKMGGFGRLEVTLYEDRFCLNRHAMVHWTCPRCREARRWGTGDDAEIEQISAWVAGEGASIQDTMPDVPAEIREAFITGVCPGCWEK